MATNLLDLARELPTWALVGLGVITGGLRAAWSFLYEHTVGYAITRVSISLLIEDTEHRDAYLWLSSWVERSLRARKVNSLLLRARYNEENGSDGDSASNFEVIPEYGTYYLVHKRRLVLVEHSKEKASDRQHCRPLRSLRVQIWFSWDRSLLLDMLQEAKSAYEQNRSKRVEYFRSDSYGDWLSSVIPARAVSSLFHPPALLEDLLQDIHRFLGSRGMYADLGIPYRRGYLFSGPPGTGKSSLILAVASHFELPIYAVPLQGSEITGERLTAMLASCRKPALIVIEDIDCLRVATSRKSAAKDGLTTADLLNVLDGIGASEGRLLFMTANHPETLDPALVRAGRVDRRFFVDYARDEELRSFHARISQYRNVEPWTAFRARLPQRATIADAQSLAMQDRDIGTPVVGAGDETRQYDTAKL